MKLPYGVKRFGRYDKENEKLRVYYVPVIWIEGEKLYVSEGDELIECGTEEGAKEIAKETYFKLLEKEG